MSKRRRQDGPWARSDKDQLEGRNIVLEALTRKVRPVTRILMDARTRPNPQNRAHLVHRSESQHSVERAPREKLDSVSITGFTTASLPRLRRCQTGQSLLGHDWF